MIVGFVDRLGGAGRGDRGGGVVQGVPVPGGGHLPCGVAVPPLPAVLPRGGRAAARAQDRRLPRGGPAVVRPVRPPVRGRAAPPPAAGRRHMAPRRGLPQDQRQAAVPVARRRPGRQRPGHPRPVPAQREGRQAVHGQADEEAAPRTEGDGHRQAQELRHRPPGTDGLGGTPLPQGTEQPRRELPPAHPPARTRHERLPLTRRSTEVPRHLQPDLTATSDPDAT